MSNSTGISKKKDPPPPTHTNDQITGPQVKAYVLSLATQENWPQMMPSCTSSTATWQEITKSGIEALSGWQETAARRPHKKAYLDMLIRLHCLLTIRPLLPGSSETWGKRVGTLSARTHHYLHHWRYIHAYNGRELAEYFHRQRAERCGLCAIAR